MKKNFKIVVCLFLSISCTLSIGCANTYKKTKGDKQPIKEIAIYKNKSYSTNERVKDLIGRMQMDEKIGQMIQVARDSKDPDEFSKYNIGSILGGGGSTPNDNSPKGWTEMIEGYQQNAADTRLGIPIIFGVDAVHGNSIVMDATVFPHNIGLGAANDLELMKNIASVTAEEMLSTGITYNFGPCVAVPKDLRWGRYYEGYSEKPRDCNKLIISVYKTTSILWNCCNGKTLYC